MGAAPLPDPRPTAALRDAVPADADALAAIHVASRAAAMPWLPVLHGPDEVRRWMADVVLPAASGPDGAARVAVDPSGAPVGFLVLRRDEVEQLYVSPGRTGEGVGSLLLADARALRPDGLRLWAFQANARALRFYARHGFREAERTDGSSNAERTPDVRLVWP